MEASTRSRTSRVEPGRLLTGTEIWRQIRTSTKQSKLVWAAVPYFASGADEILPLPAGSTLVVNFADDTIKSRGTSVPAVRRVIEAGSVAYSNRWLHAKVYVFDDSAIVGSSNVSALSSGWDGRRVRVPTLREAAYLVTSPGEVEAARQFVRDVAAEGLMIDETMLEHAARLPLERRRGPAIRRSTLQQPGRRLWVASVVFGDFPEPDDRVFDSVEDKLTSTDEERFEFFRSRWTGTSRLRRELCRGDLVIWMEPHGRGRRVVQPATVRSIRTGPAPVRASLITTENLVSPMTLSFSEFRRRCASFGFTIKPGSVKEVPREHVSAVRKLFLP